ncbi:MAG: hypothetical protein Q9221_003558 [Calogaya cf. arnoldii]
MMPTNSAILTHDGGLLTVTLGSCIITIPAPESAILWDGEPVPRKIDLRICNNGFNLHDTNHQFVLGYKLNTQVDATSLEPSAEIFPKKGTAKANDKVNEANELRARPKPTSARSVSSADPILFLPFKTPPRRSSTTKSSPATATSLQCPYPTTPEGAPQIREVPLRNSSQKSMSASERYGDPRRSNPYGQQASNPSTHANANANTAESVRAGRWRAEEGVVYWNGAL